jgi:hypothetical protein
LLKEHLTVQHLLGMALMLTGVYYMVKERTRDICSDTKLDDGKE